MKYFILLFIALPIIGFSQKDTLVLKSNDIIVNLPVKENNYVTYEFIQNLDTTLSDEVIYQNLKSTLAVITKQSSVGLNNPLFKIYTTTDPLIFEDKDSKHFIFQLILRTIKKEDDPDDVVANLIYFSKIDVRIKNHRAKVVIKDIDCYFQSVGAALLVGNANSVFKYSFNGFPDSNNKIIDGVLETNNYMAKRIFTVDFKIKSAVLPYIFSEMYKNIKENDF